MNFKSKKALAAYFCENPNLTYLLINNCPELTRLPALPTLTRLLVD